MRRVLTRSHDLEVQQWALWGQVATPIGIGGVVVSAAIALSSFLPGAAIPTYGDDPAQSC